ncbi:DUF6867 family protein [uncultured Ferrovibrio sp.]|jgi:hypothetical protein|uniref:DUF6867 family protein n=1 Tax=uncultured Ferrovibrio sp. TaxID=1576913 RepID=UPI0026108416|nr:hypothetical protein [uncultured Ferrovibrio sp.]
MNAILGESIGVFIGLTVILTGGCAFLMGQAIAGTWRPYWQVVPYSLLLAAANRFLAYALFQEQLLAVLPYLVSTAVLWGLATLGYRITLADLMVHQYPWLYERNGLLGWREK